MTEVELLSKLLTEIDKKSGNSMKNEVEFRKQFRKMLVHAQKLVNNGDDYSDYLKDDEKKKYGSGSSMKKISVVKKAGSYSGGVKRKAKKVKKAGARSGGICRKMSVKSGGKYSKKELKELGYKKIKKAGTLKQKQAAKKNPWLKFLASFRKKHKDLEHDKVLKMASKAYNK